MLYENFHITMRINRLVYMRMRVSMNVLTYHKYNKN